MSFLIYLKALHIIFVVTWFAALFYMVRLYVYHAEVNQDKPEGAQILSKQFKLMEKRLWYAIGWPSAVITLIIGIAMLVINPAYLQMGWMHVKLTFVVLLLIYHHIVHFQYKNFRDDNNKRSAQFYRYWNEVATIFLVIIVFLVVLRSTLDATYATLGFLAFIVVLFAAVLVYKKVRTKSD